MADYAKTTWVDDDGSGTTGTQLTAARANNLESGVKDAAQDSKQRGAIGARPPASASVKNWLWIDSANEQVSYCDGATWRNLTTPLPAHTHPESDITGLVADLGAKQPLDATLTAFAALASANNKLPFFTGVDTMGMADLTSFGRSIIDDVDAAAVRTTIGAQASDAELTALAGLVSAADRLPYFTGAGTASLATLTAFIRTLLDDADAATARTTLGVAYGSAAGTVAQGNDPRIPLVIDLVNQSADYDLTGLAGDTEAGYEIELIGRLSQGATVNIRPNADVASANYYGTQHVITSDAAGAVTQTIAPVSDTGMRLADTIGGACSIVAQGTLHSRSQAGRYGRSYQGRCTAKYEAASDLRAQTLNVAGWWNPTTASTVLTSLRISFGGVAAFTGRLTLRKI